MAKIEDAIEGLDRGEEWRRAGWSNKKFSLHISGSQNGNEGLATSYGDAFRLDWSDITATDWERVPEVTKGMHNWKIAQELNVATCTIATHVLNIYKKLGLNESQTGFDNRVMIALAMREEPHEP